MKPFLLLQLSDPHIGATWAPADPVDGLATAVGAVRQIDPAPDAVLVTGDLADTASDSEYEHVREMLDLIGAPYYVLPGNHDRREPLRRHFGVCGAGDEPVHYAADLGPLRLIALDTTVPGEDHGELDAASLEWLDRALAAEPGARAVIAMHHPPLLTGMPAWDELRLADQSREGLGAVVSRHPQVERIVAGHMHRTMSSQLGDCLVFGAPSTYVQATLEFNAIEVERQGCGFAIHALVDGQLVTHVQTVS